MFPPVSAFACGKKPRMSKPESITTSFFATFKSAESFPMSLKIPWVLNLVITPVIKACWRCVRSKSPLGRPWRWRTARAPWSARRRTACRARQTRRTARRRRSTLHGRLRLGGPRERRRCCSLGRLESKLRLRGGHRCRAGRDFCTEVRSSFTRVLLLLQPRDVLARLL